MLNWFGFVRGSICCWFIIFVFCSFAIILVVVCWWLFECVISGGDCFIMLYCNHCGLLISKICVCCVLCCVGLMNELLECIEDFVVSCRHVFFDVGGLV